MLAYGYDVLPVNPTVYEVLGIPACPPRRAPGRSRSSTCSGGTRTSPRVVDEAIALGAKAIWLQLGLATTRRPRVRAPPGSRSSSTAASRWSTAAGSAGSTGSASPPAWSRPAARRRRARMPGRSRPSASTRCRSTPASAWTRPPARGPADLPDLGLRLRGLAARGRPLRPQPLRQHLHADHEPDERRLRGAHGDARGRRRRARDRVGLAARRRDDDALSSRRPHRLLAEPLRRHAQPVRDAAAALRHRRRFVDPHDLDAVRAAIDARTRLLYGETIGNPRIDVLDIAGWRRSPTTPACRSSSTTPSRRPTSAGRSSTAPTSSCTRRPSSSAATAPRSAG